MVDPSTGRPSLIEAEKFQGLVLRLVGLIDAKGIDVAQPIWS